MPYALYYATAPAPKELDREALRRLVPVYFSTEKDAVHAAVLVLRGGQYVWRIEGPDVSLSAVEVEARCKPLLDFLKPRPEGK
jgi:hypothetical protein